MRTHTAITVANYETPGLMPLALVWPFTETRKPNKMVSVPRGPDVGYELTRNLRPWAQDMIRDQFKR